MGPKLAEHLRVVTTLGRILFNDILEADMPFYNCVLRKKGFREARIPDPTEYSDGPEPESPGELD